MQVHSLSFVELNSLPGYEFTTETLVFDFVTCGDAVHTMVEPRTLITALISYPEFEPDATVQLKAARVKLIRALQAIPKGVFVTFGC